MRKFAIGITVILVSCFAFGCGGTTSNESASNSDSKSNGSERPNRNKQPNGNQDNTIPANEDNLDTKPDTSSNVTFDEKSGLPSDIPIPEFVTFTSLQGDVRTASFTRVFRSTKPKNETIEILKSKLVDAGWKFLDEELIEKSGSITFYKSSQDLSKLHPKKYPKDTRAYLLAVTEAANRGATNATNCLVIFYGTGRDPLRPK
ncbi:hypothetical protein N8639_00225 [bacterium]|nr:hypothetical protein [bacterium]